MVQRGRRGDGFNGWAGGIALALVVGIAGPGLAHPLPPALPEIYEAVSPSEAQRHQLIDNLHQVQHHIETTLSGRQRQALAAALSTGITLEAAVAEVPLTPLQQTYLAEVLTAYRQRQITLLDPQQQHQLIRAGQPWQQF